MGRGRPPWVGAKGEEDKPFEHEKKGLTVSRIGIGEKKAMPSSSLVVNSAEIQI